MKDLSLLVYTNQTYLPIAELCLEQIIKHFKGIEIKKYITSNSFDKNFNFDEMGVESLTSSILFNENGSHFSEVLIKALEKINSKYVLFFLDDYFIINNVKKGVLENLISVMEDEKIDYISLMSYDYNEWETLNIDFKKYSLPDNSLVNFNYSYYYMFSVQPCIWNRESLITILQHNKNMGVHDLDITNVKNKKGDIRFHNEHGFWQTPDRFWDYNFKFVTLRKTELTKNFAFDERDANGDYFLFLYSEAIRGGKFNFKTHNNNRIFLESFLKEKNITPDLKKYKSFFI
jgi:hypothetical protein